MPPARLHWLKSLLRASRAPRDRIDRPIPHEASDGVDRELERERLTPQELELLRAWRAGQFPERTASGLLLEHRLNHTVGGSPEPAELDRREERQTAKPKFLVLEGGQASDVHSSVLGQLSAAGWLGTGTDGAPLRGPGGSVVLADAKAFEALRDLRVDPQSIRFAEEASPPSLSCDHVSVVHAEGSLAEFRHLLRAALLPKNPSRSRAEPDLVGQVLRGKYRIKRFLGKGGFGAVYEAVDEMLGAPVAVKVLHPELEQEPEVLEFFLAEAKLLTNLDHPNIVRWITFDRTDEGLHYFVMEFLRGEELAKVLRREGRLEERRVVEILLQVLGALKAAHRLSDGTSLLHLDLKPQNVFVQEGETEQVKVIDFGVSQHLGVEARAGSGQLVLSKESEKESADLFRTVVSDMATPAPVLGEDRKPIRRARGGTLLYASPEHCRHLKGSRDIVELDGRSDLYSLGVMAFQMLSGELPFKSAARPVDAMEAHFTERPRRLADLGVEVSRGLTAFIDRCLDKDRERRFRDAHEAYDALSRIARPPSRWPIVASAAGLVAAAAVWALWPQPTPPSFAIAEPGPVYFGPQRTSVDLGLENLLSFDPAKTQVRLVSDQQDAAPVLPEWSAALVGTKAPKLHIEAPGDLSERLAQRVYAEVSTAGRSQFSDAFELRYLPPGALQLERFEVEGAVGRAVDPLGATLSVDLLGELEDVDRVDVQCGDEVLHATLDPTHSTSERQRYQLSLDSFAKLNRQDLSKTRFGLQIYDRAGGVRQDGAGQPYEIGLTLEPRALALNVQVDGCIEAGPDHYVINPQSEPLLRLPTGAASRIEAEYFDGRPLELGQTPDPLGLRLSFPASKASYSAWVKVSAEDSSSIYRANEQRGRASARLRFEFQPAGLNLKVDLRNSQIVQGIPPQPDVAHTRDPKLELVLAWDGVPASVDVECTTEQRPILPVQQLTLGAQEPSKSVQLELPSDGTYRVALHGYRIASVGGERHKMAEYERELVVILDTKAPQLEVQGPSDPIARADTLPDWELMLRAQDERTEGLTAHWTSRSAGKELRTGSVDLPRSDSESTHLGRVSMSAFLLDDPPMEDGVYELAFSATDGAGNHSTPESVFRWELARKGPALRWIKPSQSRWMAREGHSFPLEIEAQDGNEVRSVQCTLSREQVQRKVQLDRDPGQATWTGTADLPAAWSGAELELECEATDAHGNRSTKPLSVVADRFEILPALRVDWSLRRSTQVPIASMRLLRGDGRYTFGGRVQAEEQRIWSQYFGRDDTYKQTSLARECAVEDFYLDETEVTVGQYLAFLEASDGFVRAENWAGATPLEERHRALLDAALGLDPALPMTGIDLAEAQAYAHWVGKRLPTLIEWEYAVRGGDAYRPFSTASTSAEWDQKGFNVDWSMEQRGAAWPVDQGRDVTPEGVRDLCSNASEWAMLDDGTTWAAGANFASMGASAHWFFRVIHQKAATRAPTLGFRCATDAASVKDLLDGLVESACLVKESP